MSSAFIWWWLALPVLALPILWHRQKQRRVQADALATAKFLPASVPQLLRVWQWVDRLLLLLRCLLLIAIIALLADLALAWRGDTIVTVGDVDPAWAAQQIASAKFNDAKTISICAQPATCPDVFGWLAQQERLMRDDARILLLANAGAIAMPAQLPQLAHGVQLRVNAAPAVTAATPRQRHIAIATTADRSAAWMALFGAFESAGTGMDRFVISAVPTPQTELIVWDRADVLPPAAWQSPLWWIARSAALPELATAATLQRDGISLRMADSARGRLWSSTQWPAKNLDDVRAIYAAWQALSQPVTSPAIMALDWPASPAPMPARSNAVPTQALTHMLLWLLLILLAMERSLAHVRKHRSR